MAEAGMGRVSQRGDGARSRFRLQLRRYLRSRLLVAGLAILVPLTIMVTIVPWILGLDPIGIDLSRKLLPPSWAHPFGTDEFGRDLLARVLYGGRLSLMVGAMSTVLTGVFGVILGAWSGMSRIADAVISRFVDALMIFPGLILGIMIVAALGPSVINVVLAMTILYTPRIVRVMRASVLEIRELDFVEAARATGAGELRILLRYVVPNAMAPLIVQLTFGFAWAILIESGLSFLGLGTPPPAPSWGNIISDGRILIRTAPWIMVSAGVMISAAVMGLNLLGDGFRDLMDPRLRNTVSKIDASPG
jgi:peptide/nickel transport system permease protein